MAGYCFLLFAACEHISRLRSLTTQFVHQVSIVTDIISALSNVFVVCCVVVACAAVVERLLLRTLRACGVLPTRRTYVVTQQYARQLDDVATEGGTEMLQSASAAGQSQCDGRAFTCREALLSSSSSLTQLQQVLQFSETKV